MPKFEDLALGAALLERLHALGYRSPTALQEDAVPVIARGTTAVGVASAGSGKTLAYGLGLAARLDAEAKAVQALVLRPTDELAAATADTLHTLISPLGFTVALALPERTRTDFGAHITVASPGAGLAALERSAIKLDGLEVLVVDGASAMVELGSVEALETITAQIPKDAQRILFTSRLNRAVEDWIERHARPARRLVGVPAEVAQLTDAAAEFYAAPRHEWLQVLMTALDAAEVKGLDRVSIACGIEGESRELADHLAVRGVRFASGDEPGVRIVCGGEQAPGGLSISWGPPADVASLQSRVEKSAASIIFVEPDELPHLQRLARALAIRLAALRTGVPSKATRSAERTRDQLREAAASRDLEPYLLLLEPLLDEFTPAEIAAAAAALLRERVSEAPAPSLPAWTRLYFGVGRRDGTRPADMVGAITGEASISGEQIGRIEIRDTYSLVEVSAVVADKVIKSLATTTIRGRSAKVRVFRE